MAAEAVGANTVQLTRGRVTVSDVLVLAAPSGRIRRSGVELQAPFAVCA